MYASLFWGKEIQFIERWKMKWYNNVRLSESGLSQNPLDPSVSSIVEFSCGAVTMSLKEAVLIPVNSIGRC